QDLPRVGCVHVKRELIMRLTCQRAEQRTANSCVRDPELSEYIHLRDDLTHHTRLFNTGARHRIASSDSVLGARCHGMADTVAIAVVDAMTDAGSTAHHLMRERRFDEGLPVLCDQIPQAPVLWPWPPQLIEEDLRSAVAREVEHGSAAVSALRGVRLGLTPPAVRRTG